VRVTRAGRRLAPAPIVLLAAALISLVAAGTGRLLAVPLAGLAALCAVLLVRRFRGTDEPVETPTLATIGEWGLALAPGVLVVYFAFNGGGYFAGSQAFVTMLLALALGLRFALATEPLAGYGPLSVFAAGALGLFALWTLLSGDWSHAPGRALVEFDRVLLYLMTLLLFASVPWRDWRLRWMLRGLAAAVVLVCAIALTTRVLPDLWPIAPDIQRGRLSYPLTYWNALGLLAALGMIFLAYLTTSEREPPLVRVLAAAGVPVVAVTLYFTFSRGGIAVAIGGLVVYALVARPRALAGGVIAAGGATAVAIVSAYGADLLASDNPTSAAATAQGHHVARVVALCVIGAALVRLALVPLDRFIEGLRLPRRLRRPVTAAAWAVGLVACVFAFLAARGPHEVSRTYDRFVHGNDVPLSGDLRTRLSSPGNNKRIEQWNVAIRAFHTDEFRGRGAGTYQNAWYQGRDEYFFIRDAHSLYAEVLGELGLVGMVLLGSALLALLSALAARTRRRRRYIGAALVAAALAWAVRAGLDWDWEMPAVTLWLFAAGGFAAARREPRGWRLRRPTRLVLSLACVLVATVPAALAVSENRLHEATTAFGRGDCVSAAKEARSSERILGFRPEPHQILAYCAARGGQPETALEEIRTAVEHDPGNWRYRYDMALMLAATGRDGAPSARLAARMNPLDARPDELAFRLGDIAVPDRRAIAGELIAAH
jgi:O-antigen ligase/polysaccharide polymerase Wzy-like membrane protein